MTILELKIQVLQDIESKHDNIIPEKVQKHYCKLKHTRTSGMPCQYNVGRAAHLIK